jgi:hypothetical protein
LRVLLLDLWSEFPVLAKGGVFDLASVSPDDCSEGFDSAIIGYLTDLD